MNGESFRVCADPHYLPWSNDQLEGIENRIAALLAKQLGQTVEYTWFPQRMGFIRNTLRSQDESGAYPCDVVMGLPAGFELALTSEPYYHSTYALVYIAGRGLDSVDSPEDLLELDAERRSKLRFGLAERNPGTLWLAKYGMLDRLTVAYASQQGDPNVRPGQFEQADLLEGTIDATFHVGPHRRAFSPRQSRRPDPDHSGGFRTRSPHALRNCIGGTIWRPYTA